jgi:uncharacterized protein
MMRPGSLRPRPVTNELTKPFWDGIAAGKLVIQRCNECDAYIHPPRHECPECRSQGLAFVAVSGRGIIHARSIVEAPVVIGFEQDVPYVCLVAELEEQKGLLVAGNLMVADPYEARIGRPVRLVFHTDPDGFTRPVFVLTEEATR